MNTVYQHNDNTYAVRLDPQPDGSLLATINGQTWVVQASPAPNGGWWVMVDGERHLIHIAAVGDQRDAHADGHTYRLTLPEMRTTSRRRSAGRANGLASLTAQMPGKVTAVLVAAGERVERGQALVILEAMKMEMRVAAPEAGIVARLLVEAGQVVERGQQLAELRAIGAE